jgi:hypothetical protein
MASQRRVAHVGLASVAAVLVTTLSILSQGHRGTPVVGQERPHDSGRVVASGDAAGRHPTPRSINVAVMNK